MFLMFKKRKEKKERSRGHLAKSLCMAAIWPTKLKHFPSVVCLYEVMGNKTKLFIVLEFVTREGAF